MICGALVVVFLGLVGQQPAEPLVLSIDDAVSMALEQNRSVRRSAQAVEEAMAALRRTQAYQGVRLDSNAQVSAQGPSSEINFPLPSGGSRSITTIPSLSWSFGLTVSQPIYHGGQLYYQERLAALGLDTARIEQQRQQQAVVRDVRSLFLSVVQSQQLERVAAENVSRSMRHLQDARARVDAGVAPGFDVIRAEAEVANANDGLVAAHAVVDKTLAALKTLLSIDVTRPVELETPDAQSYVDVEPSQTIGLALVRRPEVSAADKAVMLADASVGLARSGIKPSIDMFANFQKQSEKGLGAHDWTWALGVQATKPIFDSNLTKAAVEEAQAKKTQAEETAQQVREGIALEVYQAWLSLQEARERIDAAEKGLAQAEEAMRIADLRYQEGVAPAVEVTDARAALMAARANHVNARFAYEQARVALEYAIGEPVVVKTDETEAHQAEPAGEQGTAPSQGPQVSEQPGGVLKTMSGLAVQPQGLAPPGPQPTPQSRQQTDRTDEQDGEKTAAPPPLHSRYQSTQVPQTP
ncbi:MAG: TolC family protein [Armatimonadota bacterium]